MMCITRDEALAIVADMACPTVYNLFSNLISKRYEFIDENYKEPYFPDDSSEIVQKGYLLYHFLENNCIEEITGFNYFEFTNSIEQLRVFLESNDNDLPSELQGYSIEILFHLLLEYECWLIKGKWNNKQLTPTDFISLQEKVSNATIIVQQYKENNRLINLESNVKENTIREAARKAGKAKKSIYEKAGTITAVNEFLESNKNLLLRRGGKAELNRRITSLINTNKIPVPANHTLSPKTVDLWIDKFKKNTVF